MASATATIMRSRWRWKSITGYNLRSKKKATRAGWLARRRSGSALAYDGYVPYVR